MLSPFTAGSATPKLRPHDTTYTRTAVVLPFPLSLCLLHYLASRRRHSLAIYRLGYISSLSPSSVFCPSLYTRHHTPSSPTLFNFQLPLSVVHNSPSDFIPLEKQIVCTQFASLGNSELRNTRLARHQNRGCRSLILRIEEANHCGILEIEDSQFSLS